MTRPAFPFHGIFSSLEKGQSDVRDDAPEASSVKPVASGQQAKGQVAVDIYEHENYYIIKAPIAGVRLCDLDIEISDNVITIRGSRQQTDDIAQEQYYLQECYWGEFSRSIALPIPVKEEEIEAVLKEGVLTISFTKVKQDTVKKIQIL